MGQIVYWTILRAAILIPLLWLIFDHVDEKFWWVILIMSVYGIIIHPIVVKYKAFVETNKEIIENSLCSNCRHFDKSAVVCMKYDKHPTIDNIPCDGIAWEPLSGSNE